MLPDVFGGSNWHCHAVQDFLTLSQAILSQTTNYFTHN